MIGIPGLSIPRRRRATAAASYPLLDSLVAYWNLSEASGQRNDSHTNALHLTDNNTVTSATGPDGGTAASFAAASSEYLSRASEAALQAGNISFTLSAWAYFNSAGAANRTLISKDTTAFPNREYLLIHDGTNQKLTFAIFSASALVGLAEATGATATSQWLHMLAWVDHVGGTANISINNGAVQSAALTGTPQTTSTALRLGATANNSNYFDGRMAHTGFWKRVLTAAERTWLFNSGSGRNYAAVAAYTG